MNNATFAMTRGALHEKMKRTILNLASSERKQPTVGVTTQVAFRSTVPHVFLVCLMLVGAVLLSVDTVAAQDNRGINVRVSTGADTSAVVPTAATRQRIQNLRGGTRRVIYPVIIIADGDSLVNPNTGTVSAFYNGLSGNGNLRLDRISGYGVDPVTGRPVPMVVGPDSIRTGLAARDIVADATERDEALTGQPTETNAALSALSVTLQNELTLLRAQVERLGVASAQTEQQQAATIAALSNRIAELERDVNLLLNDWPLVSAGRSDTVVVSRVDTLLVGAPPPVRVDTILVDRVVAVNEPAKPTAVEIERALLDEGLFETVDVLFDLNESALQPASRDVLTLMAQVLRSNPTIKIQVGGHTDSTGPDAYNRTLSEKRAQTVREYLITEGNISADRLTSVGFGETQPAATNDTPAGRALNRRVAFRVVGGEQ